MGVSVSAISKPLTSDWPTNPVLGAHDAVELEGPGDKRDNCGHKVRRGRVSSIERGNTLALFGRKPHNQRRGRAVGRGQRDDGRTQSVFARGQFHQARVIITREGKKSQ